MNAAHRLFLACSSGLGRAVAVAGMSAAAAALAPCASAEEVRLISGTRYEASDVTLVPGKLAGTGDVKFTFYVGTGRATVSIPYSRVEASNLFDLLFLRTSPDDAGAQLTLARFALDRGLLREAERCFAKAATIDPTLAAERDAGLASIEVARAEKALTAAEADLKRGRGDLAIEKARAIAAKAPPDSIVAARAAALVDLASRVVDRDRKRAEAEEAERTAAAAAAHAAAIDSALARVDIVATAGVKERSRASDPDLRFEDAVRALESAAARFREARRLLTTMMPTAGTRMNEFTARDNDVLGFLVTTNLDLADMHRQARRFDRARDYLRAAQVLEPENPRIKDVRDLIETDLHTPVPVAPDEYYEPGFLDVTYGYYPTILSGSYYRPYFGSCGFGHGHFGGSHCHSSWAHGSWGNVRWGFHW
jgi:tetratricopeptide (TPR) repeat protein